jgi:hypothetical protein
VTVDDGEFVYFFTSQSPSEKFRYLVFFLATLALLTVGKDLSRISRACLLHLRARVRHTYS